MTTCPRWIVKAAWGLFALALLTVTAMPMIASANHDPRDPGGRCQFQANVAARWTVTLRPAIKTLDEAKAYWAQKIIENADSYDEQAVRATARGIELVWGEASPDPAWVFERFYEWCVTDASPKV